MLSRISRQAFRLSIQESSISLCTKESIQRTFATGVSASSAASRNYTAPTSTQDWLEDIRQAAEANVLLKRTKLSSLLKMVKNKEELTLSTEAMKIYEQKRVDPDANAVGEFVKKALELDAIDVALNVFEENYRIGIFLEPTTLNRLLNKLLDQEQYEKVTQLYQIATEKYHVKPNVNTYDALIRASIAQGDFDQATQVLQTAVSNKKIKRVTFNNLLFKLKEQKAQDKLNAVITLMKDAGITPNETTNKAIASV